MEHPLRQSTASQEIPLGFFLDSTDGDTEETGLTISNTDIWIWKTGATSLVNKNSGGATHMQNGIYYTVLDATDTNTLGPLVIFVHEAGALTVVFRGTVLPANVYDSLISGSDYLDTQVAGMDGSVITAASIAANAIGASELATDAVGAAQLASGAVDEIWDEVIEGTLTGRQLLRIFLAALAGKSAGGGTLSITFRDNADTKNRITATVDINGNRTVMTLDGT